MMCYMSEVTNRSKIDLVSDYNTEPHEAELLLITLILYKAV